MPSIRPEGAVQYHSTASSGPLIPLTWKLRSFWPIKNKTSVDPKTSSLFLFNDFNRTEICITFLPDFRNRVVDACLLDLHTRSNRGHLSRLSSLLQTRCRCALCPGLNRSYFFFNGVQPLPFEMINKEEVAPICKCLHPSLRCFHQFFWSFTFMISTSMFTMDSTPLSAHWKSSASAAIEATWKTKTALFAETQIVSTHLRYDQTREGNGSGIWRLNLVMKPFNPLLTSKLVG